MFPRRSRGVVSDLRSYVLHKPEVSTLIEFPTPEERENYSKRILQRLGVDVEGYSVLNIHQIGIRVPVRFVHEEMMRWEGNAPFWPNHIATIERIDGSRSNIEMNLFGQSTPTMRRWIRRLVPRFGTLFRMSALRLQHEPRDYDVDNARFSLYECSGGYPIGIFFQYVRSPIESQGEVEKAQLFLAVSFDFYGQQKWPRFVAYLWERIHNRVTANVMNRFKEICETEFREYTSDSGIARQLAARHVPS